MEYQSIEPLFDEESPIKHFQEIEKKRDEFNYIFDVTFFTICLILVFIFLPLIVTILIIIVFPIFVFIVCPVLCLVSMEHKPKQIPFYLKFVNSISKLGFPFVKGLPVRWVQPFNRWFGYLRVYFSIEPEDLEERVIDVPYFDDLREKQFQVRCFSYKSKEMIEGKPKIICFYCHGGGYMFGSPINFDQYYRSMVREATRRGNMNLEVFSVNYRKAPKFKIDSILKEVVEVLKWVVERNQGAKIVLSGDSAGGNLCITLAHYLRDTKYKILRKNKVHLILIYPVVLRKEDVEKFEEDENIVLESRELYGKMGVMVTEKQMSLYYQYAYENDPYEGAYNNYDFFNNLDDLPSHFIITSDYDFLRSDGFIYYHKLVENRDKKALDDEKENIEIIDDEEEEDEEFEYFKYLDIKKEVHGFSTNHLGIRNGSKKELVDAVVSNIERKFKLGS